MVGRMTWLERRHTVVRLPFRFLLHFFWGYGGILAWAGILAAIVQIPAARSLFATLRFPTPPNQLATAITDVAPIAPTVLLLVGAAIALARTAWDEARLSGRLAPMPLLERCVELATVASTFQATQLSYPKRGTALEVKCTNCCEGTLEHCRMRLDDFRRLREDGQWEVPDDFTPRFLPWDHGSDEVNLTPGETSSCAVVTHETRFVMGAHVVRHPTYLPWLMQDGQWRATLTLRADSHRPFTRTIGLESQGNEGQAALRTDVPHVLRWLG